MLVAAIVRNSPEAVQLLLADPRANPSANNWDIQDASENGHVEMVQLLLADGRAEAPTSTRLSDTRA